METLVWQHCRRGIEMLYLAWPLCRVCIQQAAGTLVLCFVWFLYRAFEWLLGTKGTMCRYLHPPPSELTSLLFTTNKYSRAHSLGKLYAVGYLYVVLCSNTQGWECSWVEQGDTLSPLTCLSTIRRKLRVAEEIKRRGWERCLYWRLRTSRIWGLNFSRLCRRLSRSVVWCAGTIFQVPAKI